MRSVYVERDLEGNIIGRFSWPKYEGQEKLAGDDPEIVALEQAEQAQRDSENLRREKISIEIENAGLKGVEPAQAYQFIDNKLNGVTNLSELTEACRDIFKRMIPYILR